MKINWGTSIVIAFGLFITFILYFVFKVQSDSKYDNDLVVEEYYKHDAKFSEEMTRIQDASDLVEKPVISINETNITVAFPKAFQPEKITGKVSLYRPSNKKLDFQLPILLSKPTLLIPRTDLAGGRWDIILNWTYEGKEYQSREVVYLR